MSFKENLKLLTDDLSYKNGLGCFMSALWTSFFLVLVGCLPIVAVFKGCFDFLAFCMCFCLMNFIFTMYKKDKRLDELEKRFKEDDREKVIDIDKMNKQREEMLHG